MESTSDWLVYGLRRKGTREVRYVGMTTRGVRKRFGDHVRDAISGKKGSRFSWIRKHGPDQIEAIVLEEAVEGNFEYLCYLEKYWETSLREFGNNLLNDKPCGSGFPARYGEHNPMYGRTHTSKSRDKIRETRIERGLNTPEKSYWYGKNLPESTKTKLRENRLGKKASAETRQKMSETRTGLKASDGARANISKALMGHEVSQETREKISRTKRANPSPANHIRWHVSRDIVKSDCDFCASTQNQGT